MKKVILVKYNGELIAVCTSKRTAVDLSIGFLLQKDFIKTQQIAYIRKELTSGFDYSVKGIVLRIEEKETNKIL